MAPNRAPGGLGHTPRGLLWAFKGGPSVLWALQLTIALATLVGSSKDYGLTTYGEACIDTCKQRGFPFTWCHKTKSRNGTFVDRDYCSSEYGVTRYSEQCLDNCERRAGKPFHWCHTHPTRRGDWDYCSPYPRDQCQWSVWGSWGRCSAPCGSPGSRTRRRRIEGASGRVGSCSGETEVAFQACIETHCIAGPSAPPSSSECQWGVWGTWSACSRSCGPGGLRRRYRVLTKHNHPTSQCPGDPEEMAECSGPACPTTTPAPTTTATTILPNLKGKRVLIGDFENTLHDVSGTVFTLGEDRLLIEDFTYDGNGPDAFFYIGTEGSPGPRGLVLAHPFEGKYYDYRDPRVPVLSAHPKASGVVLTLPPGVPSDTVQWLSVWCRQFAVDFGHVIRTPPTQQTTIGDKSTPPVTVPLPTTSSPTSVRSQEVTENLIENEVGGGHEGGLRGAVRRPDPGVITVDLPDLHTIPEETPRAIGGSRGKSGLNLNSFATGKPKGAKKSVSASSKGWKTSSGKVTGVKAEAGGGAEDVDFTVIRVQSSVSQEVSDGANEDDSGPEGREEKEEGIATTLAAARPTVTVDGFKVDKIIEIPLGNIDGVSALTSHGTTKVTTRRTTTRTPTEAATTTTTEASTTTVEATTTKTPKPHLTRQDLRDLTKNSIHPKTSTAATTPRRLRPSLFHPASRRPNRLDVLAKTTPLSISKKPSRPGLLGRTSPSPSSRRPTGLDALSRTTPSSVSRKPTGGRNTPTPKPDRALEEEIHKFFDTSTPKPRRFTVVPRLTTPVTNNDREDETDGELDEAFSPSAGGITFRPKLVSTKPTVRGVSPPRPTIGNLFGGRGRGKNGREQGSSRSPLRPFSFRPRTTAATTAATTPVQESKTSSSPGINLGVPTISPRLPPLRTTPGPVTDATGSATTRQSESPEATGISANPRHTTIIELSTGKSSGADTTSELATEAPAGPSTRRPLFARRPGLLPRRPGLARSTTVSSILSTPKVRTRFPVKNSIRNKIFARRRSTTVRPVETETVLPKISDSGELEDNEIDEVSETERASGDDRKLSGFGTKANQVDGDPSEKPTRRPFGSRRNKFKFKNKFRPIRPPFLPRRTTTQRSNVTTTPEPIPQTTAGRETQPSLGVRGPSSVRPFPFVPTRTTEPAPQTTKKSRSRPAFSRFTTPLPGVTPTTPFQPTSPRMSDDERFEIFTGFMKQTEMQTTRSGEEITTVSSKDAGAPQEEETTVVSFPASSRIVETPRSSVGSSPRNRVNSIEEEGFDGRTKSHEWDGGKVSGRPLNKPTDPTVTIRFDDIEGDYEDYPETASSPRPRVTAATTPRRRVEATTSSRIPASLADNDDYNPCDIRGTCGPNAKCEPVRSEPTCSCPNGFSGIPRNGRPDPQHGCVRTPQSCSATNGTSCSSDHVCVRDVCLQGCRSDTECALGERCISNTEDSGPSEKVCIKICFYDAHCLAGEYCEENVCRPGCRSDSNCPFGQICADGPLGSTRECEEGCNFNNDCPIEQECRGGTCVDPCDKFTECGTNAQCYTVNHLPTCRCPEGYKELNSPYDACVVASADLTLLECLEDSDCGRGSCHNGICKSP